MKTSPEEWYQAVTSFKTKPNVQVDPIHCHVGSQRFSSLTVLSFLQLFIPAGRVYSIRDTIPFHVQVSAETCQLTELFSSPFSNRLTSADVCNNRASPNLFAPKPLLRVYLIRQVMIDSKKLTSWRNTVLGEGTISPVPPAFSTCPCATTGPECQERHVDWEGEVRCRDDIDVGSFGVMHVSVKVRLRTLCACLFSSNGFQGLHYVVNRASERSALSSVRP